MAFLTQSRSRRQRDQEETASFHEELRAQIQRAREAEAARDRLEDTLRRKNEFIRATSVIASSLDLNEVLSLTLGSIAKLLDAQAASIFLMSDDRQTLVLEIATNLDIQDDQNKIRVPIGKGLAGTVAATGELINIEDAQSDPRFMGAKSDKKTGMVTQSLLTVPIRSKGEIVGVSQAINKQSAACFDQEDEELFNDFTDFAGVALTNALLYRQISENEAKTREHNQRLMNFAEMASQLGNAVEQAAQHIENSVSTSSQAHSAAESGGRDVRQMSEEVDRISKYADSTLRIIEQLSKSADSIRLTLGGINDISDRTNVLSINAAIEASRAGAYGRGFMVVVDEIRRLSSQTSAATTEISRVMNDIISGSEAILVSMRNVIEEISKGQRFATDSEHSFQSIMVVMGKLQTAMHDLSALNTHMSDLAREISARTQQTRS